MLEDYGILDYKPLIAINPIAKWKTKLWNPEKFSRLADSLIIKENAQVIFTGSQEDIDEINKIIKKMTKKAVNLAGQTTLKTLGALYEKVDVVVTTDTGPMHLAAAVGIRVVAIFGPTAPWRTGPYGEKHRILRVKLDCSPCFNRRCNNAKCMSQIEVKDVLYAVRDAIAK